MLKQFACEMSELGWSIHDHERGRTQDPEFDPDVLMDRCGSLLTRAANTTELRHPRFNELRTLSEPTADAFRAAHRWLQGQEHVPRYQGGDVPDSTRVRATAEWLFDWSSTLADLTRAAIGAIDAVQWFDTTQTDELMTPEKRKNAFDGLKMSYTKLARLMPVHAETLRALRDGPVEAFGYSGTCWHEVVLNVIGRRRWAALHLSLKILAKPMTPFQWVTVEEVEFLRARVRFEAHLATSRVPDGLAEVGPLPPIPVECRIADSAIVIAGRVHKVGDELAVRFASVLCQHRGEWVSAERFGEFDEQLASAKASRLKNKLPAEFLDLLEVKPSKGHCLRMA